MHRRFFSTLLLFATCYQLHAVAPLLLDFGADNMPPAPGWQRLAPGTLYHHGTNTFGWEAQWGSAYGDKTATDPRDSMIGAAHPTVEAVLLAEVPNGAYTVTVQVGCPLPTEGRTNQCVDINGKVMLAPPGIGAWGKMFTRRLPAIVNDGMLRIRFYTDGGTGNARVCLISTAIQPAANEAETQAITAEWETAGSPSVTRQVRLGKRTVPVTDAVRPGTLREYADPPQGMLFFSKADSGAILSTTRPDDADVTGKLCAFAALDEQQHYLFGLHARQDLGPVNLTLTPLRSEAGAFIPTECLELRTVTCLYRSVSDSTTNAEARLAGELLEAYAPFTLSKDETQGIYLLVSQPAQALPGIYRGKLQAIAGNRTAALEIVLEVLPFRLDPPPPERDWLLCVDTPWQARPPEQVYAQIKDFKRHGITGIMYAPPPLTGYLQETPQGDITAVNFCAELEKYFRFAAENGVDRTLNISGTPALKWWLSQWTIPKDSPLIKEIKEADGRKWCHIRKPQETGRAGISASGFYGIPTGQEIELTVTYRLEGDANAAFTLNFNDARRQKTQEPVTLSLPATATAFQTVSIRFPTAADTVQYSAAFTLDGSGTFTLDHIRLAPIRDLQANYIVNPYWVRRMNSDFDVATFWPDDYITSYRQYCTALKRTTEQLGFHQISLSGTDEAGGSPQHEYCETSELRHARAAGLHTFCNLSIPLAMKIPELLDAPCFYADLFGSRENEKNIVKLFTEQNKKVYQVTAGAYAGQNFQLSVNRFNVGFHFWQSSVQGSWIWTLQRWQGDPYDDFDGNTKDYLMLAPSRRPGDADIPTVSWEGLREGRRDFDYLHTLKNSITACTDPERAERGAAILAFIESSLPWYDAFDPKRHHDYFFDDLRHLAATAILDLRGLKPTTTPLPPPKALPLTITSIQAVEPLFNPAVIPFNENPPPWTDGLTDTFCQAALRLDDFRLHLYPQQRGQHATEAYLLHDRDFLYVGLRCYGPMEHLKSSDQTSEAGVFGDDSVEILINPGNPGSSGYYQFALNAVGARADLACIGGRVASIFAVNYAEHKRDMNWSCAWKVETVRRSDRWEAYATIPLAALNMRHALWGILIGRNHRAANETVSIPAIGFFDQPEKYLPIALSYGLFTTWPLTHFWAGRYPIPADTHISVRDGDNRERASTEVCELHPGDQTLTLSFPQAVYTHPLGVPPLVQLSAPRQVFAAGSGPATVHLLLAQAQPDQTTTAPQIEITLTAGQTIIATTRLLLPDRACTITIPSEQLPPGFYTLSANLTGQGDAGTSAALPLIIATGFRDL